MIYVVASILILAGLIVVVAGCIKPEPEDFKDDPRCAWCDKENAVRSQPHESHGICQRHAAEMLKEHREITNSD
jgi:hypothetical protein